MTPSADHASPRSWLLSYACVAALAAAVFGRSAGHEFVALDDHVYVTKNPVVQHGLSLAGVRWAFTTGTASNWHPLTWLSHMLDWQVFGPWAGGHHLVNVALHVVNCCLVLAVLRQVLEASGAATNTTVKSASAPVARATGRKNKPQRRDAAAGNSSPAPSVAPVSGGTDRWLALAAAAMYAVHPLRAESVVWASERKDVLSALFWWLAVLAYLRSHASGRRASVRTWIPITGLMAIGLLAKPMLVTLPAALLALDLWPLQRLAAHAQSSGNRWRDLVRLVLEKWPLWLLAAVSSAVTFYVQRAGGAVLEAGRYPLGPRLAVVLCGYAKYLAQTFWPANLAAFYPLPVRELAEQGLAFPPALVAAALLVAITAMCVWQARQRSYLLAGWLWYLVTLLPVIGLVKVGDQFHADRYTYIPQVGLLLALLPAVRELIERRPAWRRPLGIAAAVATATLAWCGYQYTGTWRNTETLARRALAVTRDNHIAHYLLGTVYVERGQPDEALAEFERGLQVNPHDYVARYDLATVQLEGGDLVSAQRNLQQIANERPQFYLAHMGLAAVFAKRRAHVETLAELDAVLRTAPDHAPAHVGRGDVLMALNRPAEAAKAYEAAQNLGVDDREFLVKYAESLVHSQQGQRAIAVLVEFTKAEVVEPGVKLQESELFGRGMYLLGLAWNSEHRPQDAVGVWTLGLKQGPWRVDTANDLAWLLATSPDAALRDGGRALELAQDMCRRISPTPAALLDTLAAAQAEAGDFAAASATLEKALADPAAQADAALAEQLRGRLALYRQSQPYRDAP